MADRIRQIPEPVRAIQFDTVAWLGSDRVLTDSELAAYQHAIATYDRSGTAPFRQPELELPCA